MYRVNTGVRYCLVASTILIGIMPFEAVSAAGRGFPQGHKAGAATTTRAPRTQAKAASHLGGPVRAQAAEMLTVGGSQRALYGGGGLMKIETVPHGIQTIGKQYINMLSPAATVLDIAKMSPSMNVATADTSGMQGGQIQSRGLTDADMGLMLNGVPATAANFLNEEADSENVETVTVTPSSSRIDLPVTAAAGGVLDETTHTPLDKAGGMLDFSYGTNNMSREFIRLESGSIAHSGLKGYFSFSNTHARSWLGTGINDRRHIDFGLRKSWANNSTSDFFISWNSEDFVVDVKPTEAQFEQYKRTGLSYGRSAEYTSGNYWRNNINHWNQIFLSARQHFVITHHISLDVTPYYTLGRGWNGSDGGTTTVGTSYYSDGTLAPRGKQLTSYFQQYADERVGVIANFGVDLGRHNRLQFGYWYENYTTPRGSPRSFTMLDGKNPSPNWAQYMVFVKNAEGQLVHNTTYTNAGDELHALFIEDTAKYFQNHMTMTVGFKYVMTNYWDNVVSPSANLNYGTNITAPLPHLSMGYRFDRKNQIYLNAEGDFRQPSPNALTINSRGEMPKPQYSIKEELGYRYAGSLLIADISFFNINITNRLLTTYTSTTQSGTINAGNQTSRGFDAMLSTHPWHHFSPFFGFEYLHSTFDTNIPYALSYLPTKGKQAIASPRVITTAGLSYDDGHFFGNASLKYVGPQSVTLVGDQRMPGYITNSLTIGYHFKPIGFMKSPTFRLNFRNLTGSIVRSSIYGTAINRQAVTLMDGTSGPSAGSGAQFWLEPRFSMTGTISTSF